MSNEIIYTAGDRTPYTYLIGWSKLDKWYYGSKTAKGCHPSDLWVKYYTSSNHVKKFRKEFGEPDVIKIRKSFVNIDECLDYEYRVLKKLDVRNNKLFLNKTDIPAMPPHPCMFSGKILDSGEYVGLVRLDDPRVISGEIVGTNHGKTQTSKTRQKIDDTMKLIGDDGLTGYQRVGKKSHISKTSRDQTGLSGYERNSRKAAKTKKIVNSDGLSIYDLVTLKSKITNSKIGEDGLSGYNRTSSATKITRSLVGIDGLNSYQRAAIKRAKTLRENKV